MSEAWAGCITLGAIVVLIVALALLVDTWRHR